MDTHRIALIVTIGALLLPATAQAKAKPCHGAKARCKPAPARWAPAPIRTGCFYLTDGIRYRCYAGGERNYGLDEELFSMRCAYAGSTTSSEEELRSVCYEYARLGLPTDLPILKIICLQQVPCIIEGAIQEAMRNPLTSAAHIRPVQANAAMTAAGLGLLRNSLGAKTATCPAGYVCKPKKPKRVKPLDIPAWCTVHGRYIDCVLPDPIGDTYCPAIDGYMARCTVDPAGVARRAELDRQAYCRTGQVAWFCKS